MSQVDWWLFCLLTYYYSRDWYRWACVSSLFWPKVTEFYPPQRDNSRNTSWVFPESSCAEFPSITTEGSWRSSSPKRMNNSSVTSENPDVGTSPMSAPSRDAASKESYIPTPFSQQEWREWKQHEWGSKGTLLFIQPLWSALRAGSEGRHRSGRLSLWHLILASVEGLLLSRLSPVTVCSHPTASGREGDSFWDSATAEFLFPLLLRILFANVQHPWILKIGVVLSSALIGDELCSTPPFFSREMETPRPPLLAGCQNKTENRHTTCLPLLETERQGGCEDRGRNPVTEIKVKHLNVLFILNFFLFLEGCNLIKTIILWSSLKLSRKVQKKMTLFKLLPRMKHFTIIILNWLEDSAFISNLDIRTQHQVAGWIAFSGAI